MASIRIKPDAASIILCLRTPPCYKYNSTILNAQNNSRFGLYATIAHIYIYFVHQQQRRSKHCCWNSWNIHLYIVAMLYSTSTVSVERHLITCRRLMYAGVFMITASQHFTPLPPYELKHQTHTQLKRIYTLNILTNTYKQLICLKCKLKFQFLAHICIIIAIKRH